MSEGRAIKSILAADLGSVSTRALLFDMVDGEYRLVATANASNPVGAPIEAAISAFVTAAHEIGSLAGRQFLAEDGRLIRPEHGDEAGVDYCLTTTSAGPPIRAMLMGLYADQDVAAARRAVAPFHIDVIGELRLDDGTSSRARLNRIAQSGPQLVVVTGGTDGGARGALLEMLSVLRQAVAAINSGSRPRVIYAGNSGLSAAVREMLSQHVEVIYAPNIRQPDGIRLDGLQQALAAFFDEIKRGQARFAQVAASSDSGFLSGARSLETMAAFFSRQRSGGAIAIDFGGGHAQISVAASGEAHTLVRHDLGLGQSAASALDCLGEEALTDWLPFTPRRDELRQYVVDKGAGAGRLPLTMRERAIEYAILRAGIRHMLAALEHTPQGLSLALLAGGILAGDGAGALNMLLLADALACDGVLHVKADPHGALAALGALARLQPQAVVQLLNGDVLEDLGALIRVAGQASRGDTAMKISLRHDNGERTQRDLKVGDLWHLPLAADEGVDMQIQTPRGLAVGGKRRLRMRLAGGRGGLLFDARLDPLAYSANASERAVNMLRWFAAATGDEQPVLIPESWLAVNGE